MARLSMEVNGTPTDFGGSLHLDMREVNVQECVNVYWDFSSSAYVPNSRDFIGLFEVGESDFDHCLDRKEKGENSARSGCIEWRVKEDGFERHATAVNFIYFRCDGVLVAITPEPLVVFNSQPRHRVEDQPHLVPSLAEHTELFKIEVYDVHCTGLHFRFKYPDPVLEFHLTPSPNAPSLPHHGQKVTSMVIPHTTDPAWNEIFEFMALPSDVLKVEVRNNSRKVRSFWGRVKIPISLFVMQRDTTVTFALEKRLPTDSATGTITLSVHNKHLDPPPENGDDPVIVQDQRQDQRNTDQDQRNTDQDQRNTDQDQSNADQDQRNTDQDQRNADQDQRNTDQDQRNTDQDQSNADQDQRNADQIVPNAATNSPPVLDTVVATTLAEPQGVQPARETPHDSEGAAPVIIVTEPPVGEGAQHSAAAIQRHASLLRSASLHTKSSRRTFKQVQDLSPSHAAAIAELAGEGQENSSAAQTSQVIPVENDINSADQKLERVFAFLDTPETDEHQLEPKENPDLLMERQQSIDDQLRSTPGFKFITRPDLYQYASMAKNNVLLSSVEGMSLIQAIRSNHSLYSGHQHNDILIGILNSFARVDCDLPAGWEKRTDPKTKKKVFVDHNNYITTYIDPRLPYVGNEGLVRSEDPLPAPIPMRTRAVVSAATSAPSSNATSSVPLAETNTYSDHVVAFLRQPDIYDILNLAHGPITPELRAAIESIRRDGASALMNIQEDVSLQLAGYLSLFHNEISSSMQQQNLQINISEAIDLFRGSDVDLIIQTISPLHDDIPPEYYTWADVLSSATDPQELMSRMQSNSSFDGFMRALLQTLHDQSSIMSSATPRHETQAVQPGLPTVAQSESDNQKIQFQTKLQTLQARYGSFYSTFNISVRRDHILADAFKCIMRASPQTLSTNKLTVNWAGEYGIDAGGPSKEFFFKLSQQLFNPYYGLFQYSNQGSYTLEISPFSSQINDALRWFKFAGRVIGFAIIQGHLLDVFFARHFYKAILNVPFLLNDIEAIDVSFYNSLVYLQQNDPEDLQLTFSVEEECFGEIVETELKAVGSKIPVTEQNKMEYIKLMVDWKLSRGIQEQMEALIAGLRELVPLDHLTPFDARELEWVIAGTPEIDLEDWKANTLYSEGYDANHTLIKWFWEAVESYSNEQKLKLLQFVSGTSSIPFGGFKALKNRLFTINVIAGVSTRLPCSHTCFNTLDLPCYSSAEVLKEKLTKAVEECQDFGFG